MTEPRLRALVVEDEWPARNYLVELLEGTRLCEVVGAVATVDEAREALSEASGLGADVAFLDVQLARAKSDRAGLELARELARQSPGVMLVLATALDKHALEAFELGAIDYLLKPFGEERVLSCVRRLCARRQPAAAPPSRIVARRKKNLVFLDPGEIWAFEAADRLTFVHTRHGRFDMDLSLAAIELSMGRSLARVHRNWLVAAAHVKELERDGAETTLFVGDSLGGSAGVRVPVARDRAQLVRDLLLAHVAGVKRP